MLNLLRQIKRKVMEIKSISNETEQALIRVVFVSFITLYLLINHSDIKPVGLCLIYLCFGFLMLFNILHHPQKNEKRQWTAMVMDITATSMEQVISGAFAGIFIGIYLWLIIGYGLRYGTKFFKGCYALSLIGFGLTLVFSPYWSQHQHLAYGFFLTLLLIPPHTMRLQINLEKATKEAAAANEAKTNFLSNISHEMRTPLNGVIGATELLTQTKLNEKQSELIQMVSTSALSLKKLINDVLDISKIEKGKIDLEEATFSLPALIQRLQLMFQLEVERKQLWLRFHVSPSAERYFIGSENHIEQVFMNLLANAIKFTQHGGVDVSVDMMDQYAHLSMLRFRIRDTGIGIKPDALPHIFDSFTQADSSISKRYGGTGLGTTIAKQLVELMDGKINVTSQESIGTTFEVILPLLHAQQPAAALTEELALETGSNVVPLSKHNKFRKKIRVLIADDNIVNRLILNETLQRQNCLVKAVDNGDEALDALESQPFDLMILDYNMPEMSGLDVYRIYHALADSKPLKTVILTADATKETQERCLNAGVYKVLTKPVISKQIKALITSITEDQLAAEQAESVSASAVIETHTIDPPSPRTGQDIEEIKSPLPPEVEKVASIQPSAEPLIDNARIEHLLKLGGSEAFLYRLITEFIDTTDDLVRELGVKCLDLRFEEVHKLAHVLAGESANMGLTPLTKCSRRLLSLNMEHAQIISNLYSTVVETYEETRTQLQQLRDTLSTKRSNK